MFFLGGIVLERIEFNEEEFKNKNEIGIKLFEDVSKNDPSSIYYERNLERPEINWIAVFLHIVIPIAICILTSILLLHINFTLFFSLIIPCLISIGYIIIRLKDIIIFLIHLYQHFAPDSIRMKCRFEPSCSQYAILALKKYGLVKGLQKSINRARRCNINNGGYDYP